MEQARYDDAVEAQMVGLIKRTMGPGTLNRPLRTNVLVTTLAP
jgi:hypothetical protein